MPDKQERKDVNWSQVQKIFSGYLKGQMLVAFCLACLYSLGLFQFTPLGYVGFAIGLFTGLLSFVPYVGFAFGLSVSFMAYSIMAFLLKSFPFDWTHVFQILGVFFCVQLIEGFFLTPKLVGRQVGIGFFASFLAIAIGGVLAGPVGVILAIPVAAILKLLIGRSKKPKKSDSVLAEGEVPADVKKVEAELVDGKDP